MTNSASKEDWEAYSEYNKVLRAWLVAFGIGVPATFLINKELVAFLSPPKGDPNIFIVFLLGAAAQVVMAFLNKVINWCTYYRKKHFPDLDSLPTTCWGRIANFIAKASDWFLIDVLFDLATIVCFSYAITRLIYLVTTTPSN